MARASNRVASNAEVCYGSVSARKLYGGASARMVEARSALNFNEKGGRSPPAISGQRLEPKWHRVFILATSC